MRVMAVRCAECGKLSSQACAEREFGAGAA
jgi:hypothetical protein